MEVEISHLEIHRITDGAVQFTVRCSAGTYIRSIAHDLGKALGCGGILSSLRRTQSGSFSVADAYKLDELQDLANSGTLEKAVVPASQLLPEFPSVHCDELIETQIRQGREFRTSPFVVGADVPLVKAISSSGDLIAIGQLKFTNVYHPMLVL